MPARLWWWCCWFSDVLGSAFSLLQSSFVAQLLDMLPVSMDPRAALARNPDQWRVQEAVFVCLQAVSREAGDLLNTGAPEVRPVAVAVAVAVVAVCCVAVCCGCGSCGGCVLCAVGVAVLCGCEYSDACSTPPTHFFFPRPCAMVVLVALMHTAPT